MTAAPALTTVPTSHIEKHEEGTVLTLLAEQLEQLGITNPPRPTGWFVLVKTYIRPEDFKEITADDGTKKTLYLPQKSLDSDQYQSISALVIACGPDAYKGQRFIDEGGTPRPWVKPGDWCIVPRYEGFPFSFRGIPMQMLPDDKIIATIFDPQDVVPTYHIPRV